MTGRELTPEENDQLCRLRKGLDRFLDERMPVLADFMQQLGMENPALVLVEAESYLSPLDLWLKDQIVTADDKIWLLTRLGYFIGEYLVQQFKGCWLLNEVRDSRYFGRYVVGHFSSVPNRNRMVDPFAIADVCIAEPPGRSLADLVAEVEQELLLP